MLTVSVIMYTLLTVQRAPAAASLNACGVRLLMVVHQVHVSLLLPSLACTDALIHS